VGELRLRARARPDAQIAQDADLELLGQVGLGEGWSRLSPLIAHAQVEHLGPRLLYAAVRSKPRMVAMRSGTARCMRRDHCRSGATRKYALLNVTGVGSSDARDGAHLMREAIRGPHQRST
jgi:hypothetical protein